MSSPHIPEAADGIFSDILIRVVEVEKLQSISGTQLGPDLKKCLQLRQEKGRELQAADVLQSLSN